MNTFNKTIKITSILAVLTIIPLYRSIAAVACVPQPPTNPTHCNFFAQCPANGTSGSSVGRDCTNLSLGDWKVTGCAGSNVSEFSGASLCSSTSGTAINFGNPVADGGGNCWCKITSIPGFSVASSAWVLLHDFGGDCVDQCAFLCAGSAPVYNSDFRSVLFAGLGL
ncbi:MAG: hypothetical protein FWG80_05050 [Alphaproteobacteria bacterium]|nr:hypothetical protein [Alphaproteobacteria bacterium]